jgi:hypothetical protein
MPYRQLNNPSCRIGNLAAHIPTQGFVIHELVPIARRDIEGKNWLPLPSTATATRRFGFNLAYDRLVFIGLLFTWGTLKK